MLLIWQYNVSNIKSLAKIAGFHCYVLTLTELFVTLSVDIIPFIYILHFSLHVSLNQRASSKLMFRIQTCKIYTYYKFESPAKITEKISIKFFLKEIARMAMLRQTFNYQTHLTQHFWTAVSKELSGLYRHNWSCFVETIVQLNNLKCSFCHKMVRIVEN